MLRDLSSQKRIDPEQILVAINSLKAKGWDINPFTVADEAKISRAQLYRKPELMDLITQMKGAIAPEGVTATDDLIQQLQQAEARTYELEETVKSLLEQNQILAEQQQDAWHKGYQVGLQQRNSEEEPAQQAPSPGFDYGPATEYGETESPKAQLPEEQPLDEVYNHCVLGGFEEKPDSRLEASGEEQDDGRESAAVLSSESGMDGEEYRTPAYDIWTGDEIVYPNPSATTGDGAPSEMDPAAFTTDELENLEPEDEHVSGDELRDSVRTRMQKHVEEGEHPIAEPDISRKMSTTTKFVGANRQGVEPPPENAPIRNVPPDVRKACLVLGLRPEDLSYQNVHKAWKKEMANPGTHPDLGGDTEIAVYLNTAKDTLNHWLDAQAPKLGKQFNIRETRVFQRDQVENMPKPEAPPE